MTVTSAPTTCRVHGLAIRTELALDTPQAVGPSDFEVGLGAGRGVAELTRGTRVGAKPDSLGLSR